MLAMLQDLTRHKAFANAEFAALPGCSKSSLAG